MSAARAATAFVLAETSSHRDIDTDTALLRSSATIPFAPEGPSIAPKQTGDGMEVDDDRVNNGDGGDPTARETTTTHMSRLPAHGMDGETNLFVNRTRLLSILAVENRVSIMADHLGSAEPIRFSQIVMASSNQLRSADARNLSNGIGKSVEVPISNTYPGAEGIPQPVGRRPLEKEEDHRPRSAEYAHNNSPSLTSGASISRVADGLDSEGYGRKKRSRTSGDEEDEVGVRGNDMLGAGQPVLSRSSSFAFGQQRHQTLRKKEDISACPSLPKLKVSRLDR